VGRQKSSRIKSKAEFQKSVVQKGRSQSANIISDELAQAPSTSDTMQSLGISADSIPQCYVEEKNSVMKPRLCGICGQCSHNSKTCPNKTVCSVLAKDSNLRQKLLAIKRGEDYENAFFSLQPPDLSKQMSINAPFEDHVQYLKMGSSGGASQLTQTSVLSDVRMDIDSDHTGSTFTVCEAEAVVEDGLDDDHSLDDKEQDEEDGEGDVSEDDSDLDNSYLLDNDVLTITSSSSSSS